MAARLDKQQRDAELRDLWSRRADLDAAGATRLCEIVLDVLQACRPKELSSLAEDNDVYVIGFIENKVLRRDLLSQCDHAGALIVFYRRYLLDEIRREKRLANLEVSDQSEEDDPESSRADEASVLQSAEVDPLNALEEAGFVCQDIAAAARTWLDKTEHWARIFVAYHNCPDAGQSEPLGKLAKRLGIKSQAYKAEKLGFNWGRHTHAGFEETLLGRWIVSLGINISPANAPLVLGALKILCFEALSWAEQQGPAA